MNKYLNWTLTEPSIELQIYGYTTLFRDHFGAARFVVAFFGIAHFVAGPFGSGRFWREFHENNFFLWLFVSFF